MGFNNNFKKTVSLIELDVFPFRWFCLFMEGAIANTLQLATGQKSALIVKPESFQVYMEV